MGALGGQNAYGDWQTAGMKGENNSLCQKRAVFGLLFWEIWEGGNRHGVSRCCMDDMWKQQSIGLEIVRLR